MAQDDHMDHIDAGPCKSHYVEERAVLCCNETQDKTQEGKDYTARLVLQPASIDIIMDVILYTGQPNGSVIVGFDCWTCLLACGQTFTHASLKKS